MKRRTMFFRLLTATVVAIALATPAVLAAEDDPYAFWRAVCAPWSSSDPMYYVLECYLLPPPPPPLPCC